MQITNEIDLNKCNKNDEKIIKTLEDLLQKNIELINTLKTTNRILLQTHGFESDE